MNPRAKVDRTNSGRLNLNSHYMNSNYINYMCVPSPPTSRYTYKRSSVSAVFLSRAAAERVSDSARYYWNTRGLSFPTKSDRERVERERVTFTSPFVVSMCSLFLSLSFLRSPDVETWNHDRTVYLSLGKMSLDVAARPESSRPLPLSPDASDCTSSAKATWE